MRRRNFAVAGVICLWIVLGAGPALAKIETVRFHPSPEGTHVHFETSGLPKYSITQTKNPNRVFITITGHTVGDLSKYLDRTASGYARNYDDFVVNSMSVVYQDNFKTRITVDLKVPPKVRDAVYKIGYNRYRLSFDFQRPEHLFERRYDIEEVRRFKARGGKVVLISAGHGGLDDGNTGLFGLTEKYLTLDTSIRLESMLNENQIRTGVMGILTRWGDYANGFTKDEAWSRIRAMGREYQADLMIEIHYNSSPGLPKQNGAELFVLRESNAEALRKDLEEQMVKSGKSRSAAASLSKTQMNQALNNSRDFCRLTLLELRRVDGLTTTRGTKEAGFGFLKQLQCPAALLEIGFLNHPTDGAMAREAEFRERVAYAFGYAITKYLTGQDVRDHVLPPRWAGLPAQHYTVRSGDSLARIAARYKTTEARLREANSLSSPLIKVGQKLTIPGTTQVASSARGPKGLLTEPRNYQPMAAPQDTVVYQVRPGDTYTDVAQRYRVDLMDLLRANGERSPMTARLRIGQEIHIPIDRSRQDVRVAQNPGSGAVATAETYRVGGGDSLALVAARHGRSVAELLAWNNLTDPNRIHVGQLLRVSPPTPTAPETPTQTVEIVETVETVAEPTVVAAIDTAEDAAENNSEHAAADATEEAMEVVTLDVSEDVTEDVTEDFAEILAAVEETEATDEKLAAAETEPAEESVADEPEAAVPSSLRVTSHRVRPGESLYTIARDHPGVSPAWIAEFNGIQEPSLIRVGQTLRIPPPKAEYVAARAADAANTVPVTVPTQYVDYVVRKNETIWAIARQFPGVSTTDILKENNISNSRSIHAGTKLRIPVSGTPAAFQPVISHVVVRGETLWDIANKYGVTVPVIRERNKLRSDVIKAGASLLIPLESGS